MELDERLNDSNDAGYYSGFKSRDGDDTIYFEDGIIEATAYSYEIATVGNVELSPSQTYNLFLAMKKYYEQKG